jgi:superfamily II DNA helicase RecQ
MRKLVSGVGDNEPELAVLCTGFDWMIQDAQFNVVKEVVGLHALFEANKKEVDKKPSMPFESWMDITTVKKYTKVWRALLCYVFRAKEQEPDKRPAYRLTSEQHTALGNLRRKIKRLRGVDIHEELEQMYGDGAEFRGLQEPALRAIMKNKSPILVIMGTGAGKSLLFMLPARSIGTGTTVVITPLVSLQNDLARRCQKVGIPCMSWDSRKAKTQGHSPTQVVIVTPEAAVGVTFSTFLNRLQGMHQLDRIVVDECHTVLDSTAQFRPK